eukprot:637670-Amphidinium_carterae.1
MSKHTPSCSQLDVDKNCTDDDHKQALASSIERLPLQKVNNTCAEAVGQHSIAPKDGPKMVELRCQGTINTTSI